MPLRQRGGDKWKESQLTAGAEEVARKKGQWEEGLKKWGKVLLCLCFNLPFLTSRHPRRNEWLPTVKKISFPPTSWCYTSFLIQYAAAQVCAMGHHDCWKIAVQVLFWYHTNNKLHSSYQIVERKQGHWRHFFVSISVLRERTMPVLFLIFRLAPKQFKELLYLHYEFTLGPWVLNSVRMLCIGLRRK